MKKVDLEGIIRESFDCLENPYYSGTCDLGTRCCIFKHYSKAADAIRKAILEALPEILPETENDSEFKKGAITYRNGVRAMIGGGE